MKPRIASDTTSVRSTISSSSCASSRACAPPDSKSATTCSSCSCTLPTRPSARTSRFPCRASRIAARHSDRPVAVEVVRWRSEPVSRGGRRRPRCDCREKTCELEAHDDDRREATAKRPEERPRRGCSRCSRSPTPTSSKCTSSSKASARSAARPRATGSSARSKRRSTRSRGLGAPFEPRAKWARALDDTNDDDRVVVAVALEGLERRDRAAVRAGRGREPDRRRGPLDARRAEPSPRTGALAASRG